MDADKLPRPPQCQNATGGCLVPPAVLLTYQTAPIIGRFAAPGLTCIMAYCNGHLGNGASEVYKSGGKVISEEPLPPLPAPIEPEPVGLDSIDPSVREV